MNTKRPRRKKAPSRIDVKQSPVVLSVDPGQANAAALYRHRKLLDVKAYRGTPPIEKMLGGLPKGSTVLLERQHMARHKGKINPRSVETLTKHRFKWEFEAERIGGLHVVLVYAASWQAILPKLRGSSTKARARVFCTTLWSDRAPGWTQDQCDAVCLGQYYTWLQERVGGELPC